MFIAQLDKLLCYRELVQQVIARKAAMKPSNRKLDSQAIADTKTDNYVMIDIGNLVRWEVNVQFCTKYRNVIAPATTLHCSSDCQS